MYSDVSVLLEEWLDVLDVHSVVLVGISLKGRSLKHLVSSTATIKELGVLLIVIGQAGDLTALPCHVTQIDRAIKGQEEEHAISKDAPLADVLELNGVCSLHHFVIIFKLFIIILNL
jgi:hypothetical protein